MIKVLKSKLQEVYVTSAREDYDRGSITIDEDLMDAANIYPWELVHVNGRNNRIITYALPGERGSGMIELNGNAAPCFEVGEKVHVLTYEDISEEKARDHVPVICKMTNKTDGQWYMNSQNISSTA